MPPADRNRSSLSVLLIAEDRLIGGDLAVTLEEMGYGVIMTSINGALASGFSSSADLVVIDVAAVRRGDAVATGGRIGRWLGRPVVYLVDDDDEASRVGEQSPGTPCVMWPFPPRALNDALQRALDATHAGPHS